MPEILEIGSAVLFAHLPEIVPWDDAILNDQEIGLLICCAGFEDRSAAFVNDFSKITIKSIAVIQYPTNMSDNVSPLDAFDSNDNWKCREVWKYDRSYFLRDVRKRLSQLENEGVTRVIIDLSGMASYVLYRILSAICDEAPHVRLGIYYAEAEHYAPSVKEWHDFYNTVPEPRDNLAIAEHYEQNKFQSSGIEDTYESDVFPGSNIGPLATQVIALPSFSLQRMKSMLAHAEVQ